MIRLVVSPDGVVVPDLSARLPGRGIWLSARRDVLDSPRLHQAVSRAARMRVVVPEDLADQVRLGLRRRIVDLIGFARRAGQAVAGFQKAREWLAAGRAALVVQASDGSVDERSRLLGGRADVAVVAPVDAGSLGRVFGRDRAVHAVVAPGRLAECLKIEAARLAGLEERGGETGPETGVTCVRMDDGATRAVVGDDLGENLGG